MTNAPHLRVRCVRYARTVPTPLRTERLTLSLPAIADVPAITLACQDPEISRWTPIPQPYVAADAEWFVRDTAARAESDAGRDWAIRLGGTVIGMISLTRRAPGNAEIGYWIAPDARGKGYLLEAARAVIDHAFEPAGLGLDRLEWNAAVGNVASARAARSLGFRFEGVRRGAFTVASGRTDAWSAGRLFSDDPTPVPWPVL